MLEVISAEPPKIFFDGFGMELPEGAYREYPKCDLLDVYKRQGRERGLKSPGSVMPEQEGVVFPLRLFVWSCPRGAAVDRLPKP